MASWLERINDPEDIRDLGIDALKEIAEEIRERLLEVTAANGGHLASSMGTTELTLALHYVFNTPEDKLVWDVGHQCYGHKLVTGRAGRFNTIRQMGGLSGFLKRSESPYDTFGAGHASTAMSAALGMAIARDLKGDDFKVVSITGDGAMSGGICFEALNNAGHLKPDILMILNDNEMSISRNVGALSSTFNRILTNHFYNEKHRELVDLIRKLPAGSLLASLSRKVEESVKGFIVPGALFEELGIRYLGPLDGHNLDELIPILQKVRTLKGPILLHLITKKGKGRPYAEQDPIKFHSPPSNFDADSGKAPVRKSGPPSFSSVFVKSLREEARRDKRIVAISAAMLEGTALSRDKVGFEEEFPDRTFDVGIAEEHAVIFAAGLTCEGLRPFVCIYSTFLQRAFDPIIHDICIQNLPVVFSIDRAGLVGTDGATHHGVFDLGYLRMIPNIVVMAAMNGRELRDMTHTAALYDEGPIALRFPRGNAKEPINFENGAEQIPIGRGQYLRRGGTTTLIGIGLMADHALRAADLLAEQGIDVSVINARFVKPLDHDLILGAARESTLVVTLEDNVISGGFGSAVLELLSHENVQVPTITLGIPDQFIHHGKPDELYRQVGLDPESIAEKIRGRLETGPDICEVPPALVSSTRNG
jgi:1-deoxy-D-xylulose-5-phosphate synthase